MPKKECFPTPPQTIELNKQHQNKQTELKSIKASKRVMMGTELGDEEDERSRRSAEELISTAILVTDRARRAAAEADNTDVAAKAERLLALLLSTQHHHRLSRLYTHPLRRILPALLHHLRRALSLLRRRSSHSLLRRLLLLSPSSADLRKLLKLLDDSSADLSWLLDTSTPSSSSSSAAGASSGIVRSLPPIAINDPNLALIWSLIAAILLTPAAADRVEAANGLSSFARDNERNKKIIVEEGGVAALLKMLSTDAGAGSAEAQIAAAAALADLADERERVRRIAAELGVAPIVQVLGDSAMRVQIAVANLVARMAENDEKVREEFARENAIRPLVSLLSIDVGGDGIGSKVDDSGKPTSFHSVVQINKQLGNYGQCPNRLRSSSYSSSRFAGQGRKDRESEGVEVKLEVKTRCAEALRFLSRGSVSNSTRITETKGLLVLARHVENERGELQLHCLLTVMEIAGVAEANADLRRLAFRTNSPAAKAVKDQLLRLIQEGESSWLLIPAVRSIGSLARTFSAKETRVLGPLVKLLSFNHIDVAKEAMIAIEKFVCPDNFLYLEHSKSVIEFNCVPPLMKLLRGDDQTQYHALVILCYLASHVGDSKDLERVRLLTVLEGAASSNVAQDPLLGELIPQAIYKLGIYQAGVHSGMLSYAS